MTSTRIKTNQLTQAVRLLEKALEGFWSISRKVVPEDRWEEFCQKPGWTQETEEFLNEYNKDNESRNKKV